MAKVKESRKDENIVI